MRLSFLAVVLFIAAASATSFNQCKNNLPAPLKVDVVGCKEQPCDVVKGTTLLMDVEFVGKAEEAKSLQAKVRATTLGITVPYELPKEVADVCNNLLYGAFCPIYKNEDVVYHFQFAIDSSYPEIGVKVEVSLVDNNDVVAACFSVNIKVKKGPSMLE